MPLSTSPGERKGWPFLGQADAKGGDRRANEPGIDIQVEAHEHRGDRRVDVVVGSALLLPQGLRDHLEGGAFVLHRVPGRRRTVPCRRC